MTRSARLAFLGAVAALLAACGTTVPYQRLGTGEYGNGGLSNSSVESTGNAATAGNAAVAAPGTATGSSGGGSAASPSSVSGSNSATTGPSGASPQGVTGISAPPLAPNAPVQVGIPYVNQQEANTLTSGIGSGLESADDQAIYTQLIDQVNSQGGVLGHPIKPIFHTIDPTQSEPQWEQSACSDFVQDHHVLVALGAAASINYMRCVTQGGAAVLGADWSNLLQSEYQQLQWVEQPDAIALDRLARLQATQFKAEGLFSSPTPAKVGVLYFDVPEFATAESILEHSLAAEGVKVVDRQAFNWVGSSQDVGATETQVQNAVLKFHSEGITQVIGVETNAWLIGFFGLDASNQSYYPRYGYTSEEVLSNVAANVPAKELQGARFIGWWPAQDLTDTSSYPAAARACIAFVNAHGQATTTGNERASALGDCENVHYLVAALEAGGEPFSRASLLAGSRRLSAGNYQPDNTFGISETSANFDGVSQVRQGEWNSSCSCFAYTTGPIDVDS